MKLRVQGDSVRFRLNRREVAEFVESGRVEAAIHFPNGATLTYGLERGAGELDAVLDGDRLSIHVPDQQLREWAATDRVALQTRRPLRNGETLEILVEKDFQCMHKGEEGKDPDAYPNPMAVQAK